MLNHSTKGFHSNKDDGAISGDLVDRTMKKRVLFGR